MRTIFLLFFIVNSSFAQLPVIKASSESASIRDGQRFYKNFWTLSPKIKPDVYFTELPQKKSRVTFVTDLDSISFETEYGKTYDFIVLLNGKDSCYTRIAAKYNGVISPTVENNGKPDTIPFTLHNSRIYFTGKVNGHDNTVIQFDLGAGSSCVNINSVAKLGLRFDGETIVTNSHGTNEEPVSTSNELELSTLKWTKIPLVQVRNMDSDEDLIIGNSLLGNRVIAIDYDKKIMIVYDRLPVLPVGYTAYEAIFDQHRPSIMASVIIGGKKYSDWFLFDTGRDGTMVIRDGFVRKFDLWSQFNTILNLGKKKVIILPELSIGGLAFKDIVTNAENPKNPSGRQSLLGNEVLNHFNVILDNPNGIIYLKPNNLLDKSYSNWTDLKRQFIIYLSASIVVLIAFVLLVRKLRKK